MLAVRYEQYGGPDVLRLSFALPRGSYALAVLREVIKSGPMPEES